MPVGQQLSSAEDLTDPMRSVFVVALATGVLVAIVMVMNWSFASGLLVASCGNLLSDWIPASRCGSGAEKLRIYAIVLTAFPIALLLERLRPVYRGQAPFSNGVFVDLCWFLLFPVSLLLIVTPVDSLLYSMSQSVFPHGLSQAWDDWPLGAKFVIAALLSDFLAWFNHWVRHKVPVLWEFHKIHHSQVELNYFTSFRIHPIDSVAISLIAFLPFTLLGLRAALPAFLGWQLFLRIYEMFVHSNIRTNLGPLRYLLVTPQSHRVHHSLAPEHADKNFGNLLAIWDFVFGTQVRDFGVYPRTGVSDASCPDGRPGRVTGVGREIALELAYPFRRLMAGLRRRSS